MLKKMNMLNSKIRKGKKSSFTIYADLESTLVLEDNGKQIQMSLIQSNIKNMLSVGVVIY